MVRMDLEYLGGLRCGLSHGPSGSKLVTDAPVDNQGRGESFSPTDLVASATLACMVTIMGIYAQREGISLQGVTGVVRKHMSTDAPRRITRLEIDLKMPAGLDACAREVLERCTASCPVRHSLHPDIEVPITLVYPD